MSQEEPQIAVRVNRELANKLTGIAKLKGMTQYDALNEALYQWCKANVDMAMFKMPQDSKTD